MRQIPLIFVLWTAGLEESIATIFVTELRRLGLPVKVVGLRRQTERGVFGLGLLPDLSLEEAAALFPLVRCLILPGPLDRLDLFSQHPHLDRLLKAISVEGKLIVGMPLGGIQPEHPPKIANLIVPVIYPETESLVGFAKELGCDLGIEMK